MQRDPSPPVRLFFALAVPLLAVLMFFAGFAAGDDGEEVPVDPSLYQSMKWRCIDSPIGAA